jgi:hypothetical protein
MCSPVRYIGIDPGTSGGFAAVGEDRATSAWACPMPNTLAGIRYVFQKLTGGRTVPCAAVLEHVWSSPGWGHAGAFTFGQSFGALEMMLVEYAIPYELVVPVKWQNELQCRTPKERREELGHADKNINKARAQDLFPGFKVTHAIADALLLAEYARRIHGSRLFTSAKEEPHGKARRTQTGKARGKGQGGREKVGPQSSAAQTPSEAAGSPGR